LKKLAWILLSSLMLFEIQCAKGPAPQAGCGFVVNNEAQRVSWKNQVPIKMYFDTSVPTQFQDSIKAAFATWEKGIGKHIFEFAGELPSSKATQDRKSVIYWEQTWDAANASQQANTTIYWVDNQITEADIRVNSQNFSFSTNPGNTDVDIESLLLHELGHVLGLAHTSNEQSVMTPFLSSGVKRRELSAQDVSGVKCEY
jgi:predicted Zn-dependent protease